MKVDVSITGADQVRAMLQRLGPALSTQALSTTVVKVEDYIIHEAGKHFKTGALNSSIYKRRLNDGSWEVGHDLHRAPHALFVVWGTKPHRIKPKNKKALRWPVGAGFRFSKNGVMHPGTKPDNWIARAAALAPQMFAFQVEQHIAQLNRT